MIGKLWDSYVDLVDRIGDFVREYFSYLVVLVLIVTMIIVIITSIIVEIIGG